MATKVLPKPRTKLKNVVDGRSVFIKDPHPWFFTLSAFERLVQGGYQDIILEGESMYFYVTILGDRMTLIRVIYYEDRVAVTLLQKPTEEFLKLCQAAARQSKDVCRRFYDAQAMGKAMWRELSIQEFECAYAEVVYTHEQLTALYDEAYPEPEEEAA